jgi:hypothetical protein
LNSRRIKSTIGQIFLNLIAFLSRDVVSSPAIRRKDVENNGTLAEVLQYTSEMTCETNLLHPVPAYHLRGQGSSSVLHIM